MPWITRPGGASATTEVGTPSPALPFHKWHHYDLEIERRDGREVQRTVTLKATERRPLFLQRIADAVTAAVRGQRSAAFRRWQPRYLDALQALSRPGEELRTFAARTVWRAAVGMGTNPALEAGLALHPLLGVPVIPGSSVRGLVHAVAERTLIEGHPSREVWLEHLLEVERDRPRSPDLPAPDDAELAPFFADAERVRALFGSLVLDRGYEKGIARRGEPAAKSLIAAWLRAENTPAETRRRLAALLAPTGGRLCFYDAVPDRGQDVDEICQVDVLTPHYPKYYADPRRPPSDDQDPIPFPFLAVAPGVRFVFPFRLRSAGAALAAGDEIEDLVQQVEEWLKSALAEWGAGGKTAAGYGSFEAVDGAVASAGETEPARGGDRGPRPGAELAEAKTASPATTLGSLLEAAPARGSDKPPILRQGSRIKATVLSVTAGGYRLRLDEVDQEVDCWPRGVRWQQGQRVKVRLVRVTEGRVREVAP